MNFVLCCWQIPFQDSKIFFFTHTHFNEGFIHPSVGSTQKKKIKTKKEKTSNKKNGNDEILHQGISKRYFERSFTIADDVKVLGAELKDGLLTVSLERIIPEEKKEKVIEIK